MKVDVSGMDGPELQSLMKEIGEKEFNFKVAADQGVYLVWS